MTAVVSGGRVCRDVASCRVLLDDAAGIDLDGASGLIEPSDRGDPQWGTDDVFEYGPDGRDTTLRPLVVTAP